jgi:hypothetical protein
MALFLTLLDRFKNHVFYERKLMKKLALFLTDVKNIFIAFFFMVNQCETNSISFYILVYLRCFSKKHYVPSGYNDVLK